MACISVFPILAGSNLRGNGKNLFWTDGKVRLRVSRTVHMEGDGAGVDRRETAASVHVAVFEAIRAWVRPGRANLELDLDFTDTRTVSAGESVVTFTDPAPFDTGACDKERHITCTLVSFTEDGVIVSASVAFNPYKRHSTLGFDGTHDIGLIMMHEMGHLLGLDHAFVGDSVMQAEADLEPAPGAPRMFAVRRLGEDDLSMLAGLYPLSPVTAISGVVRRGGAPAAGVRVMAIDAAGRVPHGAWSNEDGGYRLLVSSGNYTVIAQPAAGNPVTVDSAAGKDGVDLTLSDDSARLAVDSVGVVLNGLYAGMTRVDLARGRDYSLALTRSPVGVPVEIVAPDPPVTRTGTASSPSAAPQLVRQAVKVAPDAAVSSYALVVRAVDRLAILPGAVRIVTNPRIDAILDAETGELAVTLRAGRRYRIQGSDLAAAGIEAVPEFEGAPPPVQLAGVAIRVAGRFVPIVSISPAEAVFLLPVGAAGEPAESKVVVVAGSLVESNAVPVKLALE